MENLRKEIEKELKKIENMIINDEDKQKIDFERDKLDEMLKSYLKDM